MRTRWLEGLSPRTRAAYDEYLRLEDADKEAGYNSYDDPDHPHFIESNRAAGAQPKIQLPPPGWREKKVEPPKPRENPRKIGLRGDGWEE